MKGLSWSSRNHASLRAISSSLESTTRKFPAMYELALVTLDRFHLNKDET